MIMGERDKKLENLGYPLNDIPGPGAIYKPVVVHGTTVYVSGAVPVAHGQLVSPGKVPSQVSVAEAQAAAALCAANNLRMVIQELGSLDRIARVLRVTGYVYSSGCDPAPNALLDFWHCDDAGVYDNEGYRLRGHQFTDDDGRFTLETIVPGVYPGRTRHIHVKVQAAGGPVLTTQLYFPDEPGNERDGIIDPLLVMDIEPASEDNDEVTGFFTFIVEAPAE